MQRTLSSQLPAHVGRTVTVAGWVHRRRRLKNVVFLVLRDAAGHLQAVLPPAAAPPGEQSVVELTGTVAANPAAPAGVELVDPVLRVLSEVTGPLPVRLHRPEPDAAPAVQLDHAALALRHPVRARALRVAAAAVDGFRTALTARGSVEIHTPKVTAAATESGASVFRLDWFGRPAYLAQSPQFYKQLMVGVFERVHEVGPVFRAEPHDTARHLAQYTSLDAELGFVADHRDVMAECAVAVTAMVRAAAAHVPVPEVPAQIPAVGFAEALRIAGANPDEPDLAPAHERALGEWAAREHGSDFLFVTGQPMRKRPFYTHPDPADPAASRSFDLLFRGQELVTGGQRLHRYADYLAALAARGEDPAPYAGYLDGFRWGLPPHGGFAVGLERFTARLLGAGNVREVTAYPRDRTRLTP